MKEKTKCEICNREFKDGDGLAMHNSAKHNILLDNAKKEKSKISKKTIFLIIGILAVIIFSYFFIPEKDLTGDAISQDTQKITLGFKGNYYPNTIKVKVNQPVEITLDNSVGGCFRSFNIKELGVNYYSKNPTDTIKFTPGKKGQFKFACGMNMGTGTIIVE